MKIRAQKMKICIYFIGNIVQNMEWERRFFNVDKSFLLDEKTYFRPNDWSTVVNMAEFELAYIIEFITQLWHACI